ncbi:uracil-DNA glycosylase family protein [Vibrio sp. E150_011]
MNLTESLLSDIKMCTTCSASLPLGPRPVVQMASESRILVAGQAPGKRVHETGVPFNDPSGDRLREWMGVSKETFYDPKQMAIVPMGFCYPGTGKSGDLPPRPECALKWRDQVLASLPNIQLTLVIGQYAMAFHLPKQSNTLTENVQRWEEYGPHIIPLPHPSPRNNRWLKRNPWFEETVVPMLKKRVSQVLSNS